MTPPCGPPSRRGYDCVAAAAAGLRVVWVALLTPLDCGMVSFAKRGAVVVDGDGVASGSCAGPRV